MFSIAEKNLKNMADSFEAMKHERIANVDEEFLKLMRKFPDGTLRSQHWDAEKIQIFIPRNREMSSRMKTNVLLGQRLMAKFGPVLKPHFLNVWMVGKEDYGLCYWPTQPNLLLDVPTDFSFFEHEYASVGMPQNNPTGQAKWAGPYLDQMSSDWMISLNQPVYIDGVYHLSFGMDIILDDFDKRSTVNLLKDTYNIIFREDGRLIVHPKLMNEIKSSDGRFQIDKSGDPELMRIFNKTIHKQAGVIYDEESKLYLGVGKIPNMDWYFVMVYPESNLMTLAGKTAAFVAVMGLLSLLIEMLMLIQVLKKYVSIPIKKLGDVASRIAKGDFGTRVREIHNDEIGSLAYSFNEMAKKIEERDRLLSENASELEKQVAERTMELDIHRAKAVEAAKMASLGEISAGIAHEINNPLQVFMLALSTLRKNLKTDPLDRERLLENASKMEMGVERVTKIIRGLKSFSRKSDLDEVSATLLSSVIDNTLVLCQQTIASNGITLTVGDIPSVTVLCRESDIVQTLLNLINNSIDALASSEDKLIAIRFDSTTDEALIYVEDSGPGIPDKIAEKIMNPFFTTKDVGKGTGLGLFISTGLMQANHGRIWLNRRSPKTCFVLTLKLSKE